MCVHVLQCVRVCTCLCVGMHGFARECVCVCVCMCVGERENSTQCLWVLFAILKFIVNVSKVTEVHVTVHVCMLILPD